MPSKKNPVTQIVAKRLTDLALDSLNANKGTERGGQLLESSLSEDGLGRGILLDKDGNVIAGNQTLEKAIELGFQEVIIVPTDGKQLVATQRTDVSIDTPKGRRMAIRDNRVQQINLDFDGEVLKVLQQQDVKLDDMFTDKELSNLLSALNEVGAGQGSAGIDEIPEQFAILIDCSTEAEQTKLLTKLSEQGYKCRALLS